MSYIEYAIQRGGELEVRLMSGYFHARIDWFGPYKIPAITATDSTLEKALAGLDAAIMEDMGDEMVKKGAV